MCGFSPVQQDSVCVCVCLCVCVCVCLSLSLCLSLSISFLSSTSLSLSLSLSLYLSISLLSSLPFSLSVFLLCLSPLLSRSLSHSLASQSHLSLVASLSLHMLAAYACSKHVVKLQPVAASGCWRRAQMHTSCLCLPKCAHGGLRCMRADVLSGRRFRTWMVQTSYSLGKLQLFAVAPRKKGGNKDKERKQEDPNPIYTYPLLGVQSLSLGCSQESANVCKRFSSLKRTFCLIWGRICQLLAILGHLLSIHIAMCITRVHAEGVVLCERVCFLPSKHLLSAFHDTPLSKAPSKKPCPYRNPSKAPSQNPSENLRSTSFKEPSKNPSKEHVIACSKSPKSLKKVFPGLPARSVKSVEKSPQGPRTLLWHMFDSFSGIPQTCCGDREENWSAGGQTKWPT